MKPENFEIDPQSNFKLPDNLGQVYENSSRQVQIPRDSGLQFKKISAEEVERRNKENEKRKAAMRERLGITGVVEKAKKDQEVTEIRNQTRAATVEKRLADEASAELAVERRTKLLNKATDEWARDMAEKGFPVLVGETEEVVYDNPFNDPRIKNNPPRYVGGRIDPEPYRKVLSVGSKTIDNHQNILKTKRDLTPDEVRKIEINKLPNRDGGNGDSRAVYRHASQLSALEMRKVAGNLNWFRGSEFDACKRHADLIAVDEEGKMLAVFETVFEGSELAPASKKLREELLAINVKANGTTVDCGFIPNPSKVPGKKEQIIKGKDYYIPALKIVWRPNQLETLADSFVMDGIVTDEEKEVMNTVFADFYGQIDMIRASQKDWPNKTGRNAFTEKLNALEAKLEQIKPRKELAKYQKLTAERQA